MDAPVSDGDVERGWLSSLLVAVATLLVHHPIDVAHAAFNEPSKERLFRALLGPLSDLGGLLGQGLEGLHLLVIPTLEDGLKRFDRREVGGVGEGLIPAMPPEGTIESEVVEIRTNNSHN